MTVASARNPCQRAQASVLKSFGEILRATSRNSDICGRIGGEEFSLRVAGTKVEALRLAIDLAAVRVWRRSDGISNFEFSGQDDLLRASFLSVDAFQQQASGAGAHLISGLMNGGKRRIGEHTEIQIVEADDRNIFGTTQPEFASCEQGA